MTRRATGITWIRPPSDLQASITKYGDRAIAATKTLADRYAQKMQGEARQNASWQDRTGNARSGLMGETKATRDVITIYLYHSMWYGVFLELARGGRYAIILPTLQKNISELAQDLKRLLS